MVSLEAILCLVSRGEASTAFTKGPLGSAVAAFTASLPKQLALSMPACRCHFK
jgi:hypothetical protein